MTPQEADAMRELIERAFAAGAELQRDSDKAATMLDAVYASLRDAEYESTREAHRKLTRP